MPSVQEFIVQFTDFLKSNTSTEEWAVLAQNYERDFFEETVRILENPNATQKLNLYNAFLLFSKAIPIFKIQLSEYALNVNKLKQGEVSFSARIILRCLIEEYNSHKNEPDELLYKVLTRHRSFIEKDVPPQFRSELGK